MPGRQRRAFEREWARPTQAAIDRQCEALTRCRPVDYDARLAVKCRCGGCGAWFVDRPKVRDVIWREYIPPIRCPKCDIPFQIVQSPSIPT